MRRLTHGAALHSGVFLDGFYLKGSGEFDSWVETERASLTQLATRASKASPSKR